MLLAVITDLLKRKSHVPLSSSLFCHCSFVRVLTALCQWFFLSVIIQFRRNLLLNFYSEAEIGSIIYKPHKEAKQQASILEKNKQSWLIYSTLFSCDAGQMIFILRLFFKPGKWLSLYSEFAANCIWRTKTDSGRSGLIELPSLFHLRAGSFTFMVPIKQAWTWR